jgi:predicted pyridoxine 5'-phosphate oxidase superfamily flavin-nucleotide-binding protein
VLRSGLWEEPKRESEIPRDSVAGFLASSHFAVVSTWDAAGAGDTSPRGDPPGFLRLLDDRTLAIPDRRGNKRADTAHNLLTCDRLSLAALAPGRDEVLQVSGTAYLTDDTALLSTMALRQKAPHLALVVSVEHAEIKANEAVRSSRIWDRSTHVDAGGPPDMNRIATGHIAGNQAPGVGAAMARTLSRGLAASPPKLVRRIMDRAYRKQLEDEGY